MLQHGCTFGVKTCVKFQSCYYHFDHHLHKTDKKIFNNAINWEIGIKNTKTNHFFLSCFLRHALFFNTFFLRQSHKNAKNVILNSFFLRWLQLKNI